MFASGVTYALDCPSGQTEGWVQCCVCTSSSYGACEDCDPCTACVPCSSTQRNCAQHQQVAPLLPPSSQAVGPGIGGGGTTAPPSAPPGATDSDGNGVVDCFRAIVAGPVPPFAGTARDLGSSYGGGNSSQPCHTGYDLECTIGSPVRAPCTGVVYDVRTLGIGGLVVIINTQQPPPGSPTGGNPNPMICTIGHLASAGVAAGDPVTAGQIIAACGASGGATFPHVRYTTYQNDAPNANPPCGPGSGEENTNRRIISPQTLNNPAQGAQPCMP